MHGLSEHKYVLASIAIAAAFASGAFLILDILKRSGADLPLLAGRTIFEAALMVAFAATAAILFRLE